jgi:tripartite-type tricarboxylate transporter receptor subunit TctC
VTAIPHVKSGKVRALAITGAKRSLLLPGVPTVAESGYPGYEAMNWYAYVVPAKTPKEIVTKLNKAVVASLNSPEVIAALQKQGLDASPSSQAELATYIKSEYESWGKVIEKSGIKPE